MQHSTAEHTQDMTLPATISALDGRRCLQFNTPDTARVLNDFFLFLRVPKIKKNMRVLLAPPPTPATLFITPAYRPKREPKETKPLTRQTMIARRVAFWTLMQCPDPEKMSDPFTLQMQPFTKHRNPDLLQSLVRKPTATRKQRFSNTPRVTPRPCPICIPHPPPASPCSSNLCPPQQPKAAPPPPHARWLQPDAAACFHPAPCGSAQAGIPSRRASACAYSHTRDPLRHTGVTAPKKTKNSPNHDGHKSCIFDTGAVSRPPKHESYIHSPDTCLHQTQGPKPNNQQEK